MPVISDTSDASANSDLSKNSALADLAWLVGDAARPWLERAAAESQVSVRFAQSLRKDLSAERARLVCEQAELRRRAREKFSLAGEMFFTRRGLEQATDEWLAAYKAARFSTGTRVVDFCCGVGGDLMALARRGPAIGVDRDEAMQVLARANLSLVSVHRGEASPASESRSDVVCADVESIELADFDGWHADPDRRIEGRRATQIERLSPGVEVLERWIRAGRAGGVKLAPASETPTSWRRASCRAEHDRCPAESRGDERLRSNACRRVSRCLSG
ncbi:MAG TPA: hypothetical protein PLV92_19425, partial [Pirellulaceae bacterium]|nr:hypothetical protein [Pirellulaceae bacterium]